MPQPRPFAEYRLPPGRHGIPREQVAENQRWRLLGACAEVLAERGYAHTTSADVADGAGVSRSTFYKYFGDLDACVLTAYEIAAGCLWDVVSGTCERAGARPARLRAAIDAALEFLAAEPALAHLLGAETPAGVPAIADARAHLIARLAKLLAAAAERPPSSRGRHLVSATFALVSNRLAAGDPARLPALAPDLTELLGGAAKF